MAAVNGGLSSFNRGLSYLYTVTGDGLALQFLHLCPAIIFNLIKWRLKKWK